MWITLAFKPRINADAEIGIIIVVAEKIMIVSRVSEEAYFQRADIEDDAGRVSESGTKITRVRKIDRRKQNAAISKGIIPMAFYKDITAGSPNIM